MRGSVDRAELVEDREGEAVSVMDDMLAWLTARIEQAEREAPHAHERGCPVWDDYHYRHGSTDAQPTAGDACECGGPIRAAARVAAERAILAEIASSTAQYPDFEGGTVNGLENAAMLIAWGHRFDAPGFETEWAPSDVEVTT